MAAASEPSDAPVGAGAVRLLGAPRLAGLARETLFAAERRFQLLAILAVQAGQWVPRDRLAALLWPDREAASARGNLRTVIHRARELPGTAGLEVGEHALRWSVGCDVPAFEAAATAGQHDAALALYGGALLEGLDDHGNAAWTEWLDGERARLAGRCQAVAHEQLATLQEPTAVGALAQRLLVMDPLDETALEALLRAELAQGHGAQAKRLYQAHAELLAEQLGVEPSRALRGLMHLVAEAEPAKPLPPHAQTQVLSASPVSLAAAPGALIASATAGHFVGRRDELAELSALLARPDCRCLTLLGPGGVGKSRLAREALSRVAPLFPGFVAWVDLQDLRHAHDIGTRLARQRGLGALDEKDPVAHLSRLLPAARSLVVLDNAEHIEGLADLLQRLVEACPKLCLLLTSRVRMNQAGEWLMPLEGLTLPDADEDPEAACTFDAIRLFAQRAGEADPRFDLQAHLAAVATIARQVAGMPLALELAAGWVRLMPPADIVHELESSLDLLERHPADRSGAPLRPEHASLRTVIDGSLALLADSERWALLALSVFQGGFTRDAARALAVQGRAVSLPLLAALLDKSLLSAQGSGHYALHPLVQACAAGRLADDAAAQARARDEHASHFARYVAALAPLARSDVKGLIQAVDPELGNVRAAWQHALATQRAGALGEMVPVLTRYFESTGRLSEGIVWLRSAMAALSAPPPPPPPRCAWALQRLRVGLARMLHCGGHQDDALAVAETGLGVGVVEGDLETYLGCLGASASCLWIQGRLTLAHERYIQALALAREHQDRHCTGLALGNLAVTHQARGEAAQAIACIREALQIARELGNHYLVCINTINLSVAHGSDGNHDEAAASWRDAIVHAQAHGLHYQAVHSQGGLAGALLSLGRLDEAHAQAQLALQGARANENFILQVWMLGLLARVDTAHARHAPATAALREAAQVGRRHGLRVDLLRTARHYAMVRASQGHRLQAARMLRMVIAHPQTQLDNARQYEADLAGLNLSPEEQRSVDAAAPLSLDEVLAEIENSAASA